MPTLTTKLIRRTKPRPKRIEISCSSVRGLLLRVLPTGKKVFLYRERRNGRDNKVRIGLFGDGSGDTVTLAQARQQAAHLAVAEGASGHTDETPTKAVAAEEPTISFADLVTEFSRRHVETEALRSSTRKNYRKALEESLLAFGPRPLNSIRFADVEEFHRQNSHRQSAANNYIRVLHLMFEKAVQWEMFERRNPAHGIKLFKENKRKRYLTAEERHALTGAEVGEGEVSTSSRRRTMVKAIYWDGSGYCLWAKRLERGCFRVSVVERDGVSQGSERRRPAWVSRQRSACASRIAISLCVPMGDHIDRPVTTVVGRRVPPVSGLVLGRRPCSGTSQDLVAQ